MIWYNTVWFSIIGNDGNYGGVGVGVGEYVCTNMCEYKDDGCSCPKTLTTNIIQYCMFNGPFHSIIGTYTSAKIITIHNIVSSQVYFVIPIFSHI